MSTPDKTAIFQYFLSNLPLLRNRDYLIEILTHVDRCTAHKIRSTDWPYQTDGTVGEMYVGKLIAIRDVDTPSETLYSVTEYAQDPRYPEVWLIKVRDTGIPNSPEVHLTPQDILTVSHTEVENIPDGESIKTSVGRVMLNYIILVDPFQNIFPYQNVDWVPDKIGKMVAGALIDGRVTTQQMQRYTENLYSFGHACELGVPVYSKKMLSVNPAIKQRRLELLAQHAEAIRNGDAVIMSQIEQELVKMDMDDFKDDPAIHFLIQGKNWKVHRKALYLAVGMVEGFGDGKFNFIDRPLSEGWNVNDMPVIANEIRRMSYMRAKETAVGGEKAKFIMRVFQNTRVAMEDCGTTSTMARYVSPGDDQLIYRTIMVDGKKIVLTKENIGQYVGKTVQLRSPMQCKAGNGNYCFTCMSEVWRRLNQDRTIMVAADISAGFTLASLKAAHSQSIATFSVTNISQYCF